MADQEPPSPPPADPVVLLHSDVLLIDELQEIIEEIVAQGPIEDQEPSLRYKAEVDEPVLCHCGEEIQYRAFATLLERKGSRLSAVRKEPLTFRCDDAAYYREVLDGIDLRLPHPLVDAPGVNSLTIMISWPPHHDLRYHPLAGHNIHIVSCHDFFLVLRFGRHSSPWFYLVFNIYANSVALVPRLSTGCITTTSHCDIEAGVVIQQRNRCGDYILAELYLRRDGRTQLASNKATLCVWCSSRDSPIAGWWVQKEVVLPLPANEDQMPPTYSFRADMVFAVSTTSLCWVDLRTGILICDVIGALADGIIDSNDLRFRFIPLPEECTIKPDPLSGLGTQWGLLQAYRSMSSMHLGTIEFVCMDGLNIIESMLATWTLNLLDTTWRWEKCTAICIRDLVNDLPFWKNDRKLQQLTPSCPVISRLPGVTYLSVADLQCKNEQGCWELVGFYELCIDTLRQRILSVFEFPYVGCSVPHLNIFATDIGTYFNKHRRQTLDLRMEEEEEETRELMMVEETTELRMEEEEEETRELRMEVEESKSSLSKMGWRRYQRWRQERKLRMEKELTDEGKPKSSPSKMAESMSRPSFHSTKRIGVSPRRSEIPVGLQCVLDYPDN